MFAKIRNATGSFPQEDISPIGVISRSDSGEIVYFTVAQQAYVLPGESVGQYRFAIPPDPADNEAVWYEFTGVGTDPLD
jgi:hypothetical protein